ncbi:hypothetical protein BpHYR1_029627 [Brachionus plicatilis]|uniref:Uncharacterized protein n=1 Tax=Brachionus plicatilis TaxID=10195 RepID=A0A3M7RBX3_BRAPC|nr:hypothetical protein BpHYR1_029627 [Brachionus plicatilis]
MRKTNLLPNLRNPPIQESIDIVLDNLIKIICFGSKRSRTTKLISYDDRKIIAIQNKSHNHYLNFEIPFLEFQNSNKQFFKFVFSTRISSKNQKRLRLIND